MQTKFNTPFQMSTRDLNHAAIAKAAGLAVEVVRQAGGRRCVFYLPDVPALRELIDRYERRECLPLPAKSVLQARTELYHEAARVIREGQ